MKIFRLAEICVKDLFIFSEVSQIMYDTCGRLEPNLVFIVKHATFRVGETFFELNRVINWLAESPWMSARWVYGDELVSKLAWISDQLQVFVYVHLCWYV